MTPEQLRARILHADPRVFIINKPPGLAVHAAGRITEHLDQYLPFLAGEDGVPPRLAHRLDRDTAGCLVLGRTAAALTRMGKLFAAGYVRKTYWAVTEGEPESDEGTIDLPLLKLVIPGSWNIVTHPDGQEAITDFKVLGRDGNGRAWLELSPRTGRTHQLRVHCAAIGCPMLGEPYYGPERIPPGNLHLLARTVAFRMAPGEPDVSAVAPPPPHMEDALRACGWSG